MATRCAKWFLIGCNGTGGVVASIVLFKPLRDRFPASAWACAAGCIVQTMPDLWRLTSANVSAVRALMRTFQFWFGIGNIVGFLVAAGPGFSSLEDPSYHGYRFFIMWHGSVWGIMVMLSDAFECKRRVNLFYGFFSLALFGVLATHFLSMPSAWDEGWCYSHSDSLTGSHRFCSSAVLRMCLVNLLGMTAKLTWSLVRTGNAVVLSRPIKMRSRYDCDVRSEAAGPRTFAPESTGARSEIGAQQLQVSARMGAGESGHESASSAAFKFYGPSTCSPCRALASPVSGLRRNSF
jgi:hypothetical protein